MLPTPVEFQELKNPQTMVLLHLTLVTVFFNKWYFIPVNPDTIAKHTSSLTLTYRVFKKPGYCGHGDVGRGREARFPRDSNFGGSLLTI
ncbi:hypothetical protein SLE2022_098100 [Rubroshorea leprosula]